MVQITRPALYLAAVCYTAFSSLTLAATTDDNSTTMAPVPAQTATTPVFNTTAPPSKLTMDIESAGNGQCEIEFTYWAHDYMPRYNINFVHTDGTDSTDELFGVWETDAPHNAVNNEGISGQLNLVQIWASGLMVCMSHIKLSCGSRASGYGNYRSVTVNADAIQQSWIQKTNGDRKPVNWDSGPCMYFRSASWDSGAFRALDIKRKAFECGDDYRCIANNIETFGN